VPESAGTGYVLLQERKNSAPSIPVGPKRVVSDRVRRRVIMIFLPTEQLRHTGDTTELCKRLKAGSCSSRTCKPNSPGCHENRQLI